MRFFVVGLVHPPWTHVYRGRSHYSASCSLNSVSANHLSRKWKCRFFPRVSELRPLFRDRGLPFADPFPANVKSPSLSGIKTRTKLFWERSRFPSRNTPDRPRRPQLRIDAYSRFVSFLSARPLALLLFRTMVFPLVKTLFWSNV